MSQKQDEWIEVCMRVQELFFFFAHPLFLRSHLQVHRASMQCVPARVHVQVNEWKDRDEKLKATTGVQASDLGHRKIHQALKISVAARARGQLNTRRQFFLMEGRVSECTSCAGE